MESKEKKSTIRSVAEVAKATPAAARWIVLLILAIILGISFLVWKYKAARIAREKAQLDILKDLARLYNEVQNLTMNNILAAKLRKEVKALKQQIEEEEQRIQEEEKKLNKMVEDIKAAKNWKDLENA